MEGEGRGGGRSPWLMFKGGFNIIMCANKRKGNAGEETGRDLVTKNLA